MPVGFGLVHVCPAMKKFHGAQMGSEDHSRRLEAGIRARACGAVTGRIAGLDCGPGIHERFHDKEFVGAYIPEPSPDDRQLSACGRAGGDDALPGSQGAFVVRT